MSHQGPKESASGGGTPTNTRVHSSHHLRKKKKLVMPGGGGADGGWRPKAPARCVIVVGTEPGQWLGKPN